MRQKVFIVLSISLVIGGCKSKPQTEKTESRADYTSFPTQEHAMQAVLWQQQAAEYRALCEQAYNSARYSLDKFLATANNTGKPLAIISDLDETVIDNSPYNAKMIKLDEPFKKERWIEWGDELKADEIPGSVSFFNYAASKGIEIFYISNRYPEQRNVTIVNLQKFNLPFIDNDHILLRGETGSKQERRDRVGETYKIIMLIGDNLADFTELFENQKSGRRYELMDSLKSNFGAKFILLPNAMYGDWQVNGLYEGKYDWSETQKDSIRRSKLKSY